MKKILLVSTICAMVACGASAASTTTSKEANLMTSYYTELRVSSNFGEFKAADAIGVNDNGVLGGSLAIGTKLDNIFRVELEGWYNDSSKYGMQIDHLINDVLPGFTDVSEEANIETKAKGFFLNAYFDIPLENNKKWKPYIGGGIGYSYLESSIAFNDGIEGPMFNKSYKDHDWAWNIGFGLAYAVKEDIDLTLGYRHENLGTVKLGETLPLKFTNDKVSLGLRVNF